MNYYTLKGANANNFFKLNLNPDLYYDWDDVKKRAELRMTDETDDKSRDEIEGNVAFFQEIIDGRYRRGKIIKEELTKKDIKFIPHSYYIRNHIMYNKFTTNEVIKKMYMMKVLFEKCDVLNKWEKFKINQSNQMYSFDEKDDFYLKQYKEFLKNNPRFRL